MSEIITDAGRSIRNFDKMYLLARTDKMYKGELVRILRENDIISKRLDHNPAMPFVEYFIQDSIKELRTGDNIYRSRYALINQFHLSNNRQPIIP